MEVGSHRQGNEFLRIGKGLWIDIWIWGGGVSTALAVRWLGKYVSSRFFSVFLL